MLQLCIRYSIKCSVYSFASHLSLLSLDPSVLINYAYLTEEPAPPLCTYMTEWTGHITECTGSTTEWIGHITEWIGQVTECIGWTRFTLHIGPHITFVFINQNHILAVGCKHTGCKTHMKKAWNWVDLQCLRWEIHIITLFFIKLYELTNLVLTLLACIFRY